ncbi:MAG: hypothetical protein H0V88_04585 [Pyrinomonadaceae bacterium]|nr:hypothetical protein [Pyrinomonadaceae bacterium]
MKKNFFVLAALSLLTIVSVNTHKANAQTCPNIEAFGTRQPRPVNNSLQSQIEVTYFTTDDPNAFLSERAGISRSASQVKLSTGQFLASIERLQREGTASVTKRQSAVSFLGEMAELNLEREPVNANARMTNASLTAKNPNYIFGLNRETEVSVYQGSSFDGDYYRVRMLSSFINVTTHGARKTVDYDANLLLKPGVTAVFKLMSDDEIKRSGTARSYIAVTLRSVNAVNLATAMARR